MSTKVKIGKKNEVEIDPGLLFQRLLVLSHATTITSSEVFRHELCSYPPAIFESPTLLRKADKPQIVESIARYVEDKLEEAPVDVAEYDEMSTPVSSTIVPSESTSEIDQNVALPQEDIGNTPLYESTTATQGEHTYVLDGGSLLHRIKWKKKTTYQERRRS